MQHRQAITGGSSFNNGLPREISAAVRKAVQLPSARERRGFILGRFWRRVEDASGHQQHRFGGSGAFAAVSDNIGASLIPGYRALYCNATIIAATRQEVPYGRPPSDARPSRKPAPSV